MAWFGFWCDKTPCCVLEMGERLPTTLFMVQTSVLRFGHERTVTVEIIYGSHSNTIGVDSNNIGVDSNTIGVIYFTEMPTATFISFVSLMSLLTLKKQ